MYKRQSLGGAARVVATDGDAGAVAHLEDVLRANDLKLETPPPLKWEEATRDSAKALGAPFDVVLGADLTYNPNNAIALANALVAHAGPDSTVLLAHKRRVADDDATIAKLGEYFSTETLVAPSKVAGVAILELRKRDAKLGDLDLAAASADNCNEGFKRVDGACLLATRRAALGILASAAAAPLAASAAPLAGRFESLDLAQPEPDRGRSELSGVANLYFPPWMRGTWNVSQTLTRVEAPLVEAALARGVERGERVEQRGSQLLALRSRLLLGLVVPGGERGLRLGELRRGRRLGGRAGPAEEQLRLAAEHARDPRPRGELRAGVALEPREGPEERLVEARVAPSALAPPGRRGPGLGRARPARSLSLIHI